MSKVALRVFMVIVSLGLSACADHTSAASAPQSQTTEVQGHLARFLGRVSHEYQYASPGITLTPPGSAQADLPWTAAFNVCFTGPIGCVPQGAANVSLALVTGPGNAVVGGHTCAAPRIPVQFL